MRLTTLYSLTLLATGVTMLGVSPAFAVSVPANLDQEVNEFANEDPSDNGVFAVTYNVNAAGNEVNARYNGSGASATAGDATISNAVNDKVVTRYDISGVDKSTISDGALSFVLARSSSNNGKDQRLFGVNTGVADLNTFAEGAAYGDVPGLDADFDINTLGVIDADTTFLGTFNIAGFLGGDPGAGATVLIDQAMLDGSGPSETPEASIAQFLQSLATGDQATFIITGIGSSGQLRLLSKESGMAPTLEYSVVIPEPASVLLLITAATAGVINRRRR